MYKVYIAGPIAKPSKKKGRYGKNIVPAMEAWHQLWLSGFAPHCPHLSYWLDNYMQKEHGLELSHAEWIEQDFVWLKECDAVLRLPGESTGADMEVAYAESQMIPVFTSVQELQEAMTCMPCTCLSCQGLL